MNAATKQQSNWTNFLKFYSEQNAGRSTRLGVFEDGIDILEAEDKTTILRFEKTGR